MDTKRNVFPPAFSPQELWSDWQECRFVVTPAPSLRHAKLMQYHRELVLRYPHDIQLEDIGYSFQGRVIQLLKLGVGRKHILFWSQMHGDEPSATPALLDIADYLLANSEHGVIRSILESFTLLMIPMLNPDGAELYERRNAQGIDINRDALRLATPEGRLLKQVRDDYEPMLGLNLHDQGRMTTVGDTGCLATTSVLAVSGNAENTLTRGRLRTKRACAAIAASLSPFIPGGVARYDEAWSPLAFGDNITAWGTPVVLIESGGIPPGFKVTDLTRLNFVALMTVLKGLAEDDLAAYDPRVYEDLPENQTDAWSDVVVRGGLIMQPGNNEVFSGDLAFNYLHSGRQALEFSGQTRIPSEIFMVGDASHLGAGTSVNAHGKLLLAAFDVGVIGMPAQHWLNQGSLERLARLGVGTVYWKVDEVDYMKALGYAEALDQRGLPRFEVVTSPSGFPQLVLSGYPAENGSESIGEILNTLGVDTSQEGRTPGLLWVKPPGGETGSVRLGKGRRASFLVASTGASGQFKLSTCRLESVWLDGQLLV